MYFDIPNPTVVVAGEGCRQVAGLFSVNPVVALNQTEMDELVQAIIYQQEGNCIIAHHDRPYTDNIIRYLGKRFLSFIDYYRYGVFGLDRDAPTATPTHCAPYENPDGIPPGKSVILSPYAKSVVELPTAFWEGIATKYAGEGFCVYTNTTGAEKPIGGTAPLQVPISQMIPAVEHAGAFVGIRSGLCDVLSTARCRKTVIFPDCHYSTTPHKVRDFFALPGWDAIVADRT